MTLRGSRRTSGSALGLALGAVLSVLPLAAQEARDTLDVLFVGNRYV